MISLTRTMSRKDTGMISRKDTGMIYFAKGSLMGMLEKDKMIRPVYGYNAISLMKGVTENEEYWQVDHSDNICCSRQPGV
jgi:hypothetical protein